MSLSFRDIESKSLDRSIDKCFLKVIIKLNDIFKAIIKINNNFSTKSHLFFRKCTYLKRILTFQNGPTIRGFLVAAQKCTF